MRTQTERRLCSRDAIAEKDSRGREREPPHEQEATKWKGSEGMKQREPGAEGRKETNTEPEAEEERRISAKEPSRESGGMGGGGLSGERPAEANR